MQNPDLSEGADNIRGQLHRNKECPITGITKSGSLEEGGAGKPCSECAFTCQSVVVLGVGGFTLKIHTIFGIVLLNQRVFFLTICVFGS